MQTFIADFMKIPYRARYRIIFIYMVAIFLVPINFYIFLVNSRNSSFISNLSSPAAASASPNTQVVGAASLYASSNLLSVPAATSEEVLEQKEIVVEADNEEEIENMLSSMQNSISLMASVPETNYVGEDFDNAYATCQTLVASVTDYYASYEAASASSTVISQEVSAGVAAQTQTYFTKDYYYSKIEECYSQFTSIYSSYSDCFYSYFSVSETRQAVVNTALSMLSKPNYVWGAKANSKEEQASYDCSGFVQWCYWVAEDSPAPRTELYSTLNLTSSKVSQISYDELKPGDIGVIYQDGSYYVSAAGAIYYDEEMCKQANVAAGVDENSYTIHDNHMGIYVGKDVNGKDLWCHCRGGVYNTVVLDSFSGFQYYYRVLD